MTGRAVLALALALGGCTSEREPEAARPREAASAPARVPTRPKLVERVLILAVDGASWQLLDPIMRDGRAPHLQRLAERGVRAELETIEPTLSPAIWTTIATGMLPDRHGIPGFTRTPDTRMRTLPNARWRRVKAYWNILADFGLTTGTIGWWATWPADDVGAGSFVVTDRVPYTRMEAFVEREALTPEDGHPPGILEDLIPLVERPNDIDPSVVATFLNMNREEMDRFLIKPTYQMGSFLPEFKYAYQSDRSTLKIALKLLGERRVDVAAVYFTGIDTVSHLYWHFMFPEEFADDPIPQDSVDRWGDVIRKYYALVDDYLGRLLAVVGSGTTVVVVSDHGFGGTGRLPWSGGHSESTPGAPLAPPGILILSGPGVAATGATLSRAHVLDLAPTVLHLMGLPAGRDMPGRVLTEALTPDGPPVLPRIESYETVGTPWVPAPELDDEAGDADRWERLRALGYVE